MVRDFVEISDRQRAAIGLEEEVPTRCCMEEWARTMVVACANAMMAEAEELVVGHGQAAGRDEHIDQRTGFP